MSAPYAEAAGIYWEGGWRGVIPLPPVKKDPPPDGYTGHDGVDVSYADLTAWAEDRPTANIALRLPEGTVGFDVDAYGDKVGGATFDRWQRMHGELPPTWTSSSRTDGVSGIRLYRCREGVRRPERLIGGGVEVIQRHHRYAVVWPSWHPKTGGQYQWTAPDGTVSVLPPSIEDLPCLPQAWETALDLGGKLDRTKRQELDDTEVRAYLDGLRPGPACEWVTKRADKVREAMKEGRHDAALKPLLALLYCAPNGHAGVRETIGRLRKEWIDDVTQDGSRSQEKAAGEWKRALYGAVERVKSEPPPKPKDECDCGSTRGRTAGDDLDDVTADGDGETAAERAAARYPVVDWHQAFAKDRTEPDWLCEPLLEAGRVVAIFSPPKVGKSLLTLDVVAGLACGRAVLGNPARQPVNVLYVDMENTLDDIVERLTDLGYGPDDIARLRYLSFPDLPPLDTATGGRHLLAVAQAHDARLVVIDTVSRVIEGDEDSSDTFRHLYRHAVLPLKKAGLAVLRLDHSGKDLTRGQRGSSAKADDVDAVWSLVHRTGAKFDLRRTHSRTNHGADHVEVIRRTEPLRHEATGVGSLVDLGLVAELDRLGVPNDAGRTVARAALKDAGIKAATSVLSDAIRLRQSRSDLSGTPRTGAPDGEAPRSARAVRMAADSTPDSRSATCPGQVADRSDSEPQSTSADLSDQVHPVGMDRSAGTALDNGPDLAFLDVKLGDLGPCAKGCGEIVARHDEQPRLVCDDCLAAAS